MPVFALYDFDDLTSTALDSALGNGAQNGLYLNGATATGSQAVLDGDNDLVKIFPDPGFQMDRGTLDISFTMGEGPLCGTQTLLSRDSAGTTDGGYRIEILADGSVVISHETATGTETFGTAPGFANPGDTISLSYSWDQGGAGGLLVIDNATTGAGFTEAVPNTLTMDMSGAGLSQPWMIGAGQASSDPGLLNNVDQHFEGSVTLFQLSDTVDNITRDGIVRGTAGDDLIDVTYPHDNDGDFVDRDDAILPGDAPDDDRILAGDGNDTVAAGQGDDSVEGGAGDDLLNGENGEDTIYGQDGDDTITGGDNADLLSGDADRDDFHVGSAAQGAGDRVYGGAGGDDFDRLILSGAAPYRLRDVVADSDGNGSDGRVEFLDGDGNVTGSLTFSNIEEIVPCFTPGTLIATPKGEVPVEHLKAGDRVITRDNGIQEIRWTGQKALGWRDLATNPHLKPVLIRQGSLGNGLPERDMMVSPNHRMLVANDRTALYFDEHEVLVAAKHLVAAAGIQSIDSIGTTYIHFMFDRHEVVLSNGAWTESFQPGDFTLKGMGNAQRSEIFELFPDLRTEAGLNDYQAARRTLKKHEARLLAK